MRKCSAQENPCFIDNQYKTRTIHRCEVMSYLPIISKNLGAMTKKIYEDLAKKVHSKLYNGYTYKLQRKVIHALEIHCQNNKE
ncbi:12093_t:CDS:2 [Entrophospora sp. SA101]|nr:12093_t:CDS:2 [Entrophospora sp. SA101]